jgi:serine/threonine-protein kinase
MAVGLVLTLALGAFAARYSSLLPLPETSPATATTAARTPDVGGTGSDAPLPTWEGRKVAPPLNPPEARPVAPAATLEGDDASVKTPQKKKKKELGAIKKAVAMAGACTALGCPGTQVRPPPPEPKPCPPGAVKAMAERGIGRSNRSIGSLFMEPADPQLTPVSPGWTSVRVIGDWNKLPGGTILSGELIFGEKRVYGRLIQARTGDGTFPVCIELWDENGGRGLVRRGDSGPNTAKVFSTMDLKAVEHFE